MSCFLALFLDVTKRDCNALLYRLSSGACVMLNSFCQHEEVALTFSPPRP